MMTVKHNMILACNRLLGSSSKLTDPPRFMRSPTTTPIHCSLTRNVTSNTRAIARNVAIAIWISRSFVTGKRWAKS